MAREMGSLDEFLTHKGTERGGGTFLKNWRDPEKNPGTKLNVFLHPKVFPTAVWQHGIPKVHIFENADGESVKRVWTGKYPCAEDERVLKKQYKRDGDGTREVPPKVCGICKLIDHVYTLLEDGKVNIATPLFKFEGDDADETVILHAGGICNDLPKNMKEATKEEAALIKQAGISLRDSWKESMYAKLSYLFYIVNADNPQDGCQIAMETGLLGDKVKDVIADACESMGKEQGNPFLHPYCIQWQYLPNEEQFGNKYKARRIERVTLTSDIAAHLKSPKPDLKGVTSPPDPRTMRSILERACLKKELFPWDEMFTALPSDDDDDDEDEKSESASSSSSASNEPVEGENDNPDGDMVVCDDCGNAMKETEHTCPHCGKVYDEAAAAAAKKPALPPATRKRSAAKKGKGEQGDKVPF
jgi:hypothetical protein